MAEIIDSIGSIINSAKATVQSTQDTTQLYMQQAITASQAISTASPVPDAKIPTFTVPNWIPSDDFGNDFETAYDNVVSQDRALVPGIVSGFISAYAPGVFEAATYAQNFELNILQNGGTGLPIAVENQIYGREVDRNTKQGQQDMDEALNDDAKRGWFIARGALQDKIQTIQIQVSDKNSIAARDLAESQAKRAWDMTIKALELLGDLRAKMLSVATEYLNAYLSVDRLADAKATGLVAAKKSLYDIYEQYYKTLIAQGQMTLGGEEANMNKQLQYEKINNEAIRDSLRQQTNAAMGAAEGFAKVGAAASASQMTLAGVNQNTNQSS